MSRFFMTDRFYIYEIEVRGNQFVGEEVILDASDLYTLSIFWVKPDEVEAAVSSLPGVKEARVTSWLPSQVVIEVVERQAQIIWQRQEGRYAVDDQGTILPLEEESAGMLLVQDLTPGPLDPGEQVDPEAVRSALEWRRISPDTSAIQYSEDKGIMYHPEGYPVYLGTGDMVEKVAILNALLREFALEGIEPRFVDLRFLGSLCYGQ
jgi:cell division septal protein FtsQ